MTYYAVQRQLKFRYLCIFCKQELIINRLGYMRIHATGYSFFTSSFHQKYPSQNKIDYNIKVEDAHELSALYHIIL